MVRGAAGRAGLGHLVCRSIVALAIVALALGCADDGAVAGLDGGGHEDGGHGDGGTIAVDAAAPLDGGPGVDAGPPEEDAAVAADASPVECGEGQQDEDGDGVCLPDCDPFYCGAEGTCSIVDGARSCACNEGYAGDECGWCAPGYRVEDGCVLDVPSLEDIVLWLDASATASLTRDGTNAVASWRDRRGTSFGVMTSSGSMRPVYATGAINGRAAVRFDGVDDELRLDGFDGLSGSHYTVFVVADQMVDPESASAGIVEARPGASIGMALTRSGRGVYRFTHRMPAGAEGGDLASANWRAEGPLAMAVRRLGLAHSFFGYEDGMPRGISETVLRMNDPLPSGVTLKIGFGDAWHMLGAIAEVIVVSRGLTDAELDRIQLYLAAKYRLAP